MRRGLGYHHAAVIPEHAKKTPPTQRPARAGPRRLEPGKKVDSSRADPLTRCDAERAEGLRGRTAGAGARGVGVGLGRWGNGARVWGARVEPARP